MTNFECEKCGKLYMNLKTPREIELEKENETLKSLNKHLIENGLFSQRHFKEENERLKEKLKIAEEMTNKSLSEQICEVCGIEPENKKILDVCCGSRMFHFDKNNPDVLFMDIRNLEDTLCDGRKLEIHPDIIADFRNIPFEDNSFSLVIFDPPHLLKIGQNSWLCKKYGKLSETWPTDIKKGFDECMRVLKTNGTLIFKWATRDIRLRQILDVIKVRPIIFHKNHNTFFLVFMKGV